jgi:hypothetical protein
MLTDAPKPASAHVLSILLGSMLSVDRQQRLVASIKPDSGRWLVCPQKDRDREGAGDGEVSESRSRSEQKKHKKKEAKEKKKKKEHKKEKKKKHKKDKVRWGGGAVLVGVIRGHLGGQ